MRELRKGVLIGIAVLLCPIVAFAQDLDSLIPPATKSSRRPPAPADGRRDFASLERVAAEHPDSAGAWAALGWRLYTDSRYAEAEVVLREARRRDPDDVYTLWMSGLNAYMLHDYARSKELLMRVFTEHPYSSESMPLDVTYDVLGRDNLLMTNGDLFSAAFFFSKAADEAPGDWQYPFMLGVVEWFRDRPGEAAAALENARRLNRDKPEILRYLGFARSALYANGRSASDAREREFAAAEDAVRDAMRAEPKNYENYDMLARLYAAAGRKDDAIAIERRAIALDSAAAAPRYFLAKLLLNGGAPSLRKEAEQLLVKSIALAPWYFEGDTEAPHVALLVSLLMEDNRVAEAKALLDWQKNLPPR